MDDSRKCAHCGQAMTEAAERYVASQRAAARKRVETSEGYAEFVARADQIAAERKEAASA